MKLNTNLKFIVLPELGEERKKENGGGASPAGVAKIVVPLIIVVTMATLILVCYKWCAHLTHCCPVSLCHRRCCERFGIDPSAEAPSANSKI